MKASCDGHRRVDADLGKQTPLRKFRSANPQSNFGHSLMGFERVETCAAKRPKIVSLPESNVRRVPVTRTP